jgi:hypothetical protein
VHHSGCYQGVSLRERQRQIQKIDGLMANNFSRWSDLWSKEQRQLAWKLVQEALEAGELARQPSVICGALKVLSHHENYDDPLAITWLCQLIM